MAAPSDKLADPNFLAFVARGLNDEKHERRSEGLSFDPPNPSQRHAAILDSLAFLLVSQLEKQIIAVGVVVIEDPDPAKVETQIIVAENKTPLDASIQKQQPPVAGKRDSPPHLRPHIVYGTGSPVERELVDLEIALITYSWPKLKQRMMKNKRHLNFIDVVADVYGVLAQERIDLDSEGRDLLDTLQKSSASERDLLQEMTAAAREAAEALQRTPTRLNAVELRTNLQVLLIGRNTLQKHTSLVDVWDQYTRHRLLQKGAQVRKKPDVLRWLSKVSSIREHYLHIAQIPISPTLSGLLLRGVKVIVLKNPPPVRKFSLDRDELENILVSAGCEFIAKDKSEKSIEKFLDKLVVAHGKKVTDGKLDVSITVPVHCECLLLVHLHQQPAVPYIGVSKLSCGFCRMYFAAYREVTRVEFYARGSHGQTGPWTLPVLGDATLSLEIRQKSSQSTAASGEVAQEDENPLDLVRQERENVRAEKFRSADRVETSFV
ncbi:hypothetical protein GGX14DRAFT_446589 [Mycena pura]|uniref:Uncharacterized protein n=1 Tax=Mycena pura TaxID=153505 RepID=A0AAD6YBV7_9AGAR|nr:hypothetical protein GGX14DRAFT_446589 [Mycena pura]